MKIETMIRAYDKAVRSREYYSRNDEYILQYIKYLRMANNIHDGIIWRFVRMETRILQLGAEKRALKGGE